MKHQLVLSSCLVLTLAACSSAGGKNTAKGSFEYAKLREPNVIQIPDNLAKPRISEHYKIKEITNKNGPVGSEMDIRAPALALPLAAGARIEPEDKGAIVWFDQVDDSSPLVEQVRRALTELFAEKAVELSASNKALEFETGWIQKTYESGAWFWTSEKVKHQSKYKISLQPKPHGRSLSLAVELTDFEPVENGVVFTEIDKSRSEIAMVNEIVSHVGYQYRVDEFNRQKSIAKEDLVRKSDDGSTLLVRLPLDALWENMPTFFEKYGFTQTDLDEAKKVYYVDYEQPDASFWDSVWGDAVPILVLANGSYQFRLTDAGTETKVELLDSDGNAISNELFNEIYGVLSEALTFR